STAIFIIGKSFSAFATASINIGVNVRFSFSRFAKVFFTLLRQFQTLVTSHSTNDCTCAEVWILSTMWWAISLPILVISIISSSPFTETVVFGFGVSEVFVSTTVCGCSLRLRSVTDSDFAEERFLT